MNSELKRLYKRDLIAAIASSSLGFITAVFLSTDTFNGYVSGWTWLGFLIVVAVASLLLLVAGLFLLLIKRELTATLILSSVLLTSSFLLTLYVMEKVGWIHYHPPYTESVPTNEQSDKTGK